LIAIGLPTRWAREVLLFQHGVSISISTVPPLVIAIPPVLIAVWRLPGFVLSIPWDRLAITVTAFYLATFAATLISSQRLRARHRTAL
jgi:hypothetical protein